MRSFKDVIKETRRVAINNPLGRNENAGYANADGTPCCIFGHALRRLGFSPSELLTGMEDTILHLDWDGMGFEQPNRYESMWSSAVQWSADNGAAWIVAVARADARLI